MFAGELSSHCSANDQSPGRNATSCCSWRPGTGEATARHSTASVQNILQFGIARAYTGKIPVAHERYNVRIGAYLGMFSSGERSCLAACLAQMPRYNSWMWSLQESQAIGAKYDVGCNAAWLKPQPGIKTSNVILSSYDVFAELSSVDRSARLPYEACVIDRQLNKHHEAMRSNSIIAVAVPPFKSISPMSAGRCACIVLVILILSVVSNTRLLQVVIVIATTCTPSIADVS